MGIGGQVESNLVSATEQQYFTGDEGMEMVGDGWRCTFDEKCSLLVNERNQRDLKGAWLGPSFGLLLQKGRVCGRAVLCHCVSRGHGTEQLGQIRVVRRGLWDLGST